MIQKRLTIFSILLTLFVSMIFVSCSKPKGEQAILPEDMDLTVSPADDFYTYAAGNWLKNNPIPDEHSMWASFVILHEENNDKLADLMEEVAAAKAEEGSPEQKVRDFYKLGMDSAKIENDGFKPLQAELDRINNIKSTKDLVKEVAHMHMYTSAPLFYFFASVDAKNSGSMIGRFYQGGIGLPDVEYYYKEDGRSKEIREKYLEYVKTIFLSLGKDEKTAAAHAATIMKIETRLAKASLTRLEQRDPQRTYNKMTTKELKKSVRGFDWDLYFSELGIEDPKEVNVSMPDFMKEVGKMVKKVTIDDWKVYLKWNVVESNAAYLSSSFVNARFDFFNKFLRGSKVIQPRWKRVLGHVNGALGEVVGQLYVKKHFPPAAKQKAKEIVDNLIVSMGERIKETEWMSDVTKEKALTKLKAFGVKIGYPDKWRDYSSLEIKTDSYVQNVIRSNYFDFREDIEKINKPVDKTEWGMTPQTVNAYYSPTRNEIVFPAAILQAPFFSLDADDAVNYGAMGAVIGHEITHGFDDQGRQYDAEGNIKDWWTDEDSEKFNDRAKVIIKQFNQYNAIDSMYVDGELTQGENIADLGGLNVSFKAFEKTEQFRKGEKIAGLTPQQRFFMSWTRIWRNNIRDDALKLRIKTDVHSPGKFRVIGPFSNMPEFYSAFDVKENNKMYRAETERVKIW